MGRPYGKNMENQSKLYHRRSIRLKGYDYSLPGAYFVTIVTQGRSPILGNIIAGETYLTTIGKIIEECWIEIPLHFRFVSLDAHVIMPNHLHGIVNIIENHNKRITNELPNNTKTEKSSQSGLQHNSLGAIIGSFKSSVTRKIRQRQISYPYPIWQRNYYEHIIRNEEDYDWIVEYIQTNPLNWEIDEEFIAVIPFNQNDL
jgi:REP element-mobilizing transposase RayT